MPRNLWSVTVATAALGGGLRAQPASKAAAPPTREAPARSPFASYRTRVAGVADSAVYSTYSFSNSEMLDALVHAPDSPTPEFQARFDTLAANATHSASVIGRLSKDFDMVAPPAGLDRVHGQILEALGHLKAAMDSVFSTALACKYEPKSTYHCHLPAASAGLAVLTANGEYLDARKRVATLLQEHGLSLPRMRDRK